jgi:hypothetical protein
MTGELLYVPEIEPDADTITAALAYAVAGWYVLPVRQASKHAGWVVGKHWQTKSSRDPQQIAAWFAGTDYALAVHVGRSGGIVFDVDTPEQLPAVLSEAVTAPPYQSTREDVPGRGHYVFAQPPGRVLGNSTESSAMRGERSGDSTASSWSRRRGTRKPPSVAGISGSGPGRYRCCRRRSPSYCRMRSPPTMPRPTR